MCKLAFMLGAALALAPAPLAAQVCLGYPTTRGQSDLGGAIRYQIASPLDVAWRTQYAGTYSGVFSHGIVADGLVAYDHYTAHGQYSGGTAGARLGLDIIPATPPSSFSVCPHAGLSFARGPMSWGGNLAYHNQVTVPLGLGTGGVFWLNRGRPHLPLSRPAARGRRKGLLLFVTAARAYERPHHGCCAPPEYRGPSDTFTLSEIGVRYVVARSYVGASVIRQSGGRTGLFGLAVGFPLTGASRPDTVRVDASP